MEEVLKVKMFGTFSMSYGNQSITGKSKSNESNFITLMEALLHAGKKALPETR